MTDWLDSMAQWTRLSRASIVAILQTLAVLILVWVARWLILHLLGRRVQDVKRHYYWRRSVNYSLGVVALMLIVAVWFEGMRGLGTFLGLLSAGIAIALQDLLGNLAGWLFILTRRPFAVGDRIELAGHRGDVIDIGLFLTHLMECGHWVDADQSTGRIVSIPTARSLRAPSPITRAALNTSGTRSPC